MKKILVIAAHPDDEVLGCGGTLAKYSKKGSKVKIIFLSDGETSRDIKIKNKKILNRQNSAIKALKTLGVKNYVFGNFPDNKFDTVPLLEIVKYIEKEIKNFNPSTIFTHHYNDLNVDHQITSNATMTACRPKNNNNVNLILFFEILSSTEWKISDTKNKFDPNWFEDITFQMNLKLKAIKYYKSELKKNPHSRSLETIKALAVFRGSSSGVKFAESFVLGRKI